MCERWLQLKLKLRVAIPDISRMPGLHPPVAEDAMSNSQHSSAALSYLRHLRARDLAQAGVDLRKMQQTIADSKKLLADSRERIARIDALLGTTIVR
jgi:hypothetical protein